jgi:tetratricopeptide (TPR) repeat protein
VRTSRPQEVTLPSSATLAKLESAPVKPPAARVNEAPQSAPPPIQEAEDVSRPIASKTVALKADAARPALSLAEQLSEARSLHARRDWQTALVHYEQIAQSAPGTYEGLLAQHKTAQIYARAGRHEEAFDRYQRILKENPRYRHIDRVLLEGGKVGIALRQWDKAKGMLETCYNRYPSLRRDVAPYLEVAKQFAALPIVDAEVDGDALQP